MTKIHRLTKQSDFHNLKASGVTFVLSSAILKILKNDENLLFSRAAFIASRKIGGAVQRNKAKRRLREVVRKTLPYDSGISCLFIARKNVLTEQFSTIVDDVSKALLAYGLTSK